MGLKKLGPAIAGPGHNDRRLIVAVQYVKTIPAF
jgi:hypothetical protein